MSESDELVYLNGQEVPKREACLSVEDRGALFADGVYEVVRYYGGRGFALDRHMARLHRSLQGIRLEPPASLEQLPTVTDRLVERNGLTEAKAYWQVTRGAAARDHRFPGAAEPTVLVMTYPAEPAPLEPVALTGMLAEDRRWADGWIKSLMLLPNVLARQRAAENGADEAILHHGETITEGSATSVMMVRDGEIWTHPLDGRILGSITRQVMTEQARRAGVSVREAPFSVEALYRADEALICGTTTHVAGLTHVDGEPIGGGHIGPLTRRLHEWLLTAIDEGR